MKDLTESELLEQMLEPLYLAVPGTELDRMRGNMRRMTSVLNKASREGMVDHLFFGAFSEEYDIAFAVPNDAIQGIYQSTINRLSSDAMIAKAASVSTLVSAIGDFMVMKNDLSSEIMTELMAHCILRLYVEDKNMPIPIEPGRNYMCLVHMRHRDLNGSKKALFIAFKHTTK